MNKNFSIKNGIVVNDLWMGLAGHHDSLSQIINEYIDNAVSNFEANDVTTRQIKIRLKELSEKGEVQVVVEDTGTGIKNIDSALTIGDKKSAETPLNEHGFGLKHALASANPSNDLWTICTRTEEDEKNNCYRKIKAPYQIACYSGEIIEDEKWPSTMNSSTGTIIEFTCTREMFKTIGRGIQGGMTDFWKLSDILCEEIGYIYSGIIVNAKATIILELIDAKNVSMTKNVGAVMPDYASVIPPGNGHDKCDLGNGDVDIEYYFGSINEKPSRTETKRFNNETTRKYYKKSMSTSGVEIRINGRLLCDNIFSEIWGIEKHNSYNHLLIQINLKSDDIEKLPKTRTSKNGFREGEAKLAKLYEWIRRTLPTPTRDTALVSSEKELFETLKERLETYTPDPNKVIKLEERVFMNLNNLKDTVKMDMYTKIDGNVTAYEGKIDTTTTLDAYQLRMYWDGLVYDGIHPNEGFLVAKKHPDTVSKIVDVINDMKDANGNRYNIKLKTWKELGIKV